MVDGIESNENYIPKELIKLTRYEWAVNLYEKGLIRLNSIEYYRKIENNDYIGDKNEGIGIVELNGHHLTSGSINKVYLYCFALPDTDIDLLKESDKSYDTIIQLYDTKTFINRIMKEAVIRKINLHPHVGIVNYTKGTKTTKKEMEKSKWHENIFQKDKKYQPQNEYRISFMDFDIKNNYEDYLSLEIGACNDIIDIRKI